MAQSNPVNVLDVCRVAPICDSTAQTSVPLTFYDMHWLRYPPTQRLFFYEFPYPKSTLADTIIPKLKHSLSVTLQHYTPLAGNLTWPPDSGKPIVQYKEGDAVSLTIAECEEENFYQRISGNSFREAKELRHLLPYLLASQTSIPVLALQITLFPNAGFCIGYAAHHAMFDGKSITMFMHSWASICKHDGNSTLIRELTPIFDRTLVKDPSEYFHGGPERNEANDKSLEIHEMEAPPDAMLGTFQLTKANIESIKKWVEAKWQEKHTEKKPAFFHPSTFAIASAYTWVCLVKARKITTEKVHLVIPIECRARLEPPIPSTYFGNCVSACIADAVTNKCKEEDGFAMAAWAIREAIRSLDVGVREAAKELIPKFVSIMKEGGVMIGIGGSPRFELYKTDFGWGRPSKVDMVSIDKSGAFSLLDSRDVNVGGVEIGVVLKKHETEAFASLFASGLEQHQVHNS